MPAGACFPRRSSAFASPARTCPRPASVEAVAVAVRWEHSLFERRLPLGYSSSECGHPSPHPAEESVGYGSVSNS